MVKGFLSQRGIAYEERDVSRSHAYAQELVRSTQQMGVPVTAFDGQTIIGFDRGRLEQLVGSIQANQRPSFGASIADAASITARQGAEVIRGAYVGRTRPGSIAQKIGLISGDIITQLNMTSIANAGDFERAISALRKEAHFSLVFLRGDATKTAEGVF